MKPIFLLTVAFLVIAGTVIFTISRTSPRPTSRSNISNTTNTAAVNVTVPEPTNLNTAVPSNVNAAPIPTVTLPIADFFNRVTKKPFGIYITPQTSPVQPEKFTGYHTGADAETTPAEKDVDIPIMAIVDGTVVFAGRVNGYGGVIIIRHTINGAKLLSLYGHLRIASFTPKVGAAVSVGQQIAVLGTGYSSETDGERKHLHFGLIKGWTINYKGYITTKSALSAWEDPATWLQAHGEQF